MTKRDNNKVTLPECLHPMETAEHAPREDAPVPIAKPTATSWRSDLWGRIQAAGITAEQFQKQFGSLKELAEDKRDDVEAWLEDMRLAGGEQ